MIEMVKPQKNLVKISNSIDSSESKTMYFNLKSIKVTWENNKKSFMHIFVDTTGIKKLEEEKAKINCQNIMFASVSHEFRTPINAFENSLQLIKLKVEELMSHLVQLDLDSASIDKMKAIDFSIQKFFKMGNISSKLLMHLIEDILDLGKFEAGIFSLNENEFDLKDLIEDINYLFLTQSKEKGLKFTVNVSDDLLHFTYKSDLGRIKQVLLNLISNSLKFTQRGGSITLDIEQITESYEEYLKFSVTDTGVGIPFEDLSKLFKMFSMLDKHKEKMNQRGAGIGLAISKKIIDSLGGDIVVKSEEGKYS